MDVYVCYSRTDKEKALLLEQELERYLSPISVCVSPTCDATQLGDAKVVVALDTSHDDFSSCDKEEGKEHKIASNYNKRILYLRWERTLRDYFGFSEDFFLWYDLESKERFMRCLISLLGKSLPVYNVFGSTVPLRIKAHYVEPYSLSINGREVLSAKRSGGDFIFNVVFMKGTYDIECRSDSNPRYTIRKQIVVSESTSEVEMDLNSLADDLGYPYESVDYQGYRRGVMRHGKLTGRVQENTKDFSCEGDIRNGHLTGKVRFDWMDGTSYVGEWIDGRRSGKGVLTWSDGTRYEGDFVDGRMSGSGKIVWTNGSSYEGGWKDDRREGYGVFIWPNGSRLEGDWKDGKCTGNARYTKPDGSSFQGLFFEGKPVGKGIFYQPDGSSYDGELTELLG